MTRYIYSFIRKDLSHTQRIIQSLHSGYELALHLKPFEDSVPSSVCLFEVTDEEELIGVYHYLLEERLLPNKDFHVFFEPDGKDPSWTSITTRPMEGFEREIFKGFELYRDENYTDQDEATRAIVINHC